MVALTHGNGCMRFALALILATTLGNAAHAATFVVTSAADPGNVVCDATCTLREAITAANLTAAADTINFAVPAHGEVLISLASALPTIVQPLTINDYSSSGTSVNTLASGSNAVLRVRVEGAGAGATTSGFSICANSVTITGLSITGFQQYGIVFGNTSTSTLCAAAVTGGIAAGNFIGLRSNGTTAGGNAIGIFADQAQIVVGGGNLADRNVISSSVASGVDFVNAASSGSSVLNNLIGTDKSGGVDHGNGGVSVLVAANVANLVIGTTTAPNLIAFNQRGIGTLSGRSAATPGTRTLFSPTTCSASTSRTMASPRTTQAAATPTPAPTACRTSRCSQRPAVLSTASA